jgi:hypothetical protein
LQQENNFAASLLCLQPTKKALTSHTTLTGSLLLQLCLTVLQGRPTELPRGNSGDNTSLFNRTVERKNSDNTGPFNQTAERKNSDNTGACPATVVCLVSFTVIALLTAHLCSNSVDS